MYSNIVMSASFSAVVIRVITVLTELQLHSCGHDHHLVMPGHKYRVKVLVTPLRELSLTAAGRYRGCSTLRAFLL